ncbi:MAG: glycosyltransferase family 2 protein, partial [Proteobacteria bacterium]|nr:glycosyltransferase family 2 protein [Pseudomonadota bacterium]
MVGRVDEVFRGGFGRNVEHEIIVVDDGSADDTQSVLVRLCSQYPQLRAVVLRRNSGKSMALMAGFALARGNVIVTLDADLQDNPEDIPALAESLATGFDLVIGRRQKRKDTLIRKLGSRLFNWAVRRAAGVSVRDMNSGFKIYKAEVIRNIAVYGQFHRFIPLLAHSYGFKIGECPVRNSPRRYGSSKFTTLRYQGLVDLLSLLFIHNYHLSPLHFFAKMSAVFVVPSASILMYFILRHVLAAIGIGGPYMITERPLLSISLTMFLIGINVLLTGFVCDFI